MTDSLDTTQFEGSSPQLNLQPTSVDLRTQLLPVQDQGDRGTCLAFAVTAAHEYARGTQAIAITDLSEEALYWRAKQLDGDYKPGTSFLSAREALQQWGQPEESVWPYDPERYDLDGSYEPPNGDLPLDASFSATLVRAPKDTSGLKQELAQGKVVAAMLDLWEGFYEPSAGHISLPETANEFTLGVHVISLVGYVDTEVKSNESDTGSIGYFILRNSWGTEWGDGGYGYLAYEFFERFPVNAYTVEPYP